MGHSIKNLLIIISLLIAIIILLFIVMLAFPNNAEDKNEKAIEAAIVYLEKNYEQEMVFEKVTKSKEESWSVEFSKKNNPDFIFDLQVSQNKETKEFQVWRDDYIKALIEYELCKQYKSTMEQIWGVNVRVIITYQIYTKNLTYLHEHSILSDIQTDDLNQKYSISIHIPYYFEQTEKKVEIEKIYDFIKILQENEYMPYDIAVCRLSSTENTESKNNEEYCFIYGLDSIEGVEPIQEYVDKYWFKESAEAQT